MPDEHYIGAGIKGYPMNYFKSIRGIYSPKERATQSLRSLEQFFSTTRTRGAPDHLYKIFEIRHRAST